MKTYVTDLFTAIWPTLALFVKAGIFNSVMDTLQFWHGESIFKDLPKTHFFGKDNWIRKYRYSIVRIMNGRKIIRKYKIHGPRFWGSKTYFVFVNDGWHLSQLLMLICFATNLFVFDYTITWWWEYPLIAFLHLSAFGGTFEIFVEKIWKAETWN